MVKIQNTELGPVEYSIRGKGHPVLYFHGGHSNAKDMLLQTGWPLPNHRIIIPSRPGYGNTPLNQNTTPQQTARLINALVESLQIEKLIVVGVSAGGLSAIEYAAQYPHKTCSLILISAVTRKWLDKNDKLYKVGQKMFSPKMEKISWIFFRIFFRIFPKMMSQTLFDQLSKKPNQKITKAEIEQIKEMVFNQASGNGFVTDLDQNIENRTIGKVACSTLILHSENDESVPIQMAHHADKKINNSVLKTYDNKWGHLLWVGEDRKYPFEDLNEFLKEVTC